MSTIRIVHTVPDSAKSIVDSAKQNSTTPVENLENLANYEHALASGALDRTSSIVALGAVAASGTGTFTGAATAAQTMTIAGVTLTANNAPDEDADEFLSAGGTVTLSAASLASAINSSSGSLYNIVTATAALGVVTITAKVPGAIGNGLATVDVNTANFTFAQAVLASGSEGTPVSF